METMEEIKNLGYRVVYVPHEVIKDYNACYNVIYDGKNIKPNAADVMGIPLNEIWISERWKKYEKIHTFPRTCRDKVPRGWISRRGSAHPCGIRLR